MRWILLAGTLSLLPTFANAQSPCRWDGYAWRCPWDERMERRHEEWREHERHEHWREWCERHPYECRR